MSFPLVGNARIREAVLSAVRTDRLPHAILIDGDRGTGRHTLASFIIHAAVCSAEERPCGVCRECHLAGGGAHPDITTAAPEDGKKSITVAQIRALRNEAYVKPHMARRRVLVIDGADTMNEQAQNALLKVLEEPPGAALFVLIAENKASLLDTVLSRCTVFSPAPAEISLGREYIAEHYPYERGQIDRTLEETGGNIGRALMLLQGDVGKAEAAVEEFIKALLASNTLEMLKITAGLEKKRTEAEAFFKALKTAAAAGLKSSLAAPFKARMFSELYSLTAELEKGLAVNVNLSLLFTALVCEATDIGR